jgi:phosphatidate cytidylyltransferase
VWFFDIGAYVVGMKFGRIRISPNYSPKKSLEGVLGGIGFTIAYIILFEIGASFINIFNHPDGTPRDFFDPLTLIIMGLIVAFFGTFGDIFESVLKRYRKIKDAGNIMPGHGGLLDRIDGLLFAAPVLYIFLLILI